MGPDSYVKKQLNEILNDENIPLSTLPFDLFYDQKKGLIEIIVDVPFDLPIPKETAQLYASGKLWLKNKAGKDIANEKILFYLGLQFYLASKLFGLALNISTVRVSLVESIANLGITWIEFNREIFRQLILSQHFDLFSTALYYNHYFEPDNITGLKKIPLSQFNQKVSSIIDKTICLPQSNTNRKQSNLVDISISEAKLLAASVHDNQTLIDAIRQAEQNQMRTVPISKGLATVLKEVTITNESAGTLMSEKHNEYTLSDYAQSEYEEYQVTEIIDASSSDFETALQTLIRNVVELESPISRDLLNRRICTAMGISRVSARLNEKIVSILSKMNLFTTQTDKIFYWSDSIRPDNFKIFRKSGKRDALDIAPEEILNCIIYNIKQTGKSDRSQVLRSVANEFGFTRMGVNVQASMEAGIICGINNGILTDEGGIISSTL